MGVMDCSRVDCEHIMCDVYVDGVGYVCNYCESEFKDYLEKTGKTPETEGQIKRDLEIFMKTPKDSYVEGDEMDVGDFFNSYRR